MGNYPDSPLDHLWEEYGAIFDEWDDLTLARWMSQTLGQLQGRSWRLSHPLLGAYRLAATAAHDRQIWLKRLVNIPAPYPEAPCCRAPLLPLLTRDVLESGLVCQHCSGTAVALDQLPRDVQAKLKEWAEEYAPIHEIAHWDEKRQKKAGDYDRTFETAAERAEELLARAGKFLGPALLETQPAVVWEDQDECLEVRPEDIEL